MKTFSDWLKIIFLSRKLFVCRIVWLRLKTEMSKWKLDIKKCALTSKRKLNIYFKQNWRNVIAFKLILEIIVFSNKQGPFMLNLHAQKSMLIFFISMTISSQLIFPQILNPLKAHRLLIVAVLCLEIVKSNTDYLLSE